MKIKNKTVYFFVLSVFLIASDQFSKIIMRNHFGVVDAGIDYSRTVYDSISVLGKFLQFTYTENEGMAMGITFGAGKIFLSIFSVLASIALSYYLYKLNSFSNWLKLGVALILAGAVGNLIDRVFYGLIYHYDKLFYGRVIDFIKVEYFPFIFNIADSCVSVGVAFLILFHKKIPTFKELMNRQPDDNIQVPEQSISNDVTRPVSVSPVSDDNINIRY